MPYERTTRAFIHLAEASFGPRELADAKYLDEILISRQYDDGVIVGEFTFRWYEQNGRQVPRLEVFDDAWALFKSCPQLLNWMARMDGQNVTPEQVCVKLLELGFKDVTERADIDVGRI